MLGMTCSQQDTQASWKLRQEQRAQDSAKGRFGELDLFRGKRNLNK